MKTKTSKISKLAFTGTTGLAFMQAASAATILTGGGSTANNVDLEGTGHGSNAVGTPNISLAWTASNSADGWDFWTSRATATNTPFTAWPNDPSADGVYQMDDATPGATAGTGAVFNVVFTPDAGFNAVVSSADINAFTGGGSFVMDWSVTGASSGLLGSADDVVIAADGLTALTFGDLTGSGSEVVTLTFAIDDTSTGTGSYLAMDNLAFDQIPEPSSTGLAALGLGAMAMRRRRK